MIAPSGRWTSTDVCDRRLATLGDQTDQAAELAVCSRVIGEIHAGWAEVITCTPASSVTVPRGQPPGLRDVPQRSRRLPVASTAAPRSLAARRRPYLPLTAALRLPAEPTREVEEVAEISGKLVEGSICRD